MKRNIGRKSFLKLNVLIWSVIVIYPILMHLSVFLPGAFRGCFFHKYLLLYCPLCGGTRAIQSLLRLDILSALRFNPLVTVGILLFLVAEVVLWIRFFQKKDPVAAFPERLWIVFAIVFGGFFLLRNYLMIFHSIDPTGDLWRMWQVFLPFL